MYRHRFSSYSDSDNDYDVYGDNDDFNDVFYDDVLDEFNTKQTIEQSNMNHHHFSSNSYNVYDNRGRNWYHTDVFYHGDSFDDRRVRDYLKFDEIGNVVDDENVEDVEDVLVIDIFNGDFENVPRQIAQKDAISLAFYKFLCNNNVPNAWYLFKCHWFTQSFALGCLLSSVVKAGHAHRINVYADDLQQHLEGLML